MPTTFPGFAHQWTPLALSSEVRRKPIRRVVATVPVVLFRGTEGQPAALVDRCPHRGVALSLGKVDDGCLVCPFHGWRFDGRGTNVGVPWNPDVRRDRLGAEALPVREIGGLVWVYTAVGEAPVGEPSVPDELLRDDVRLAGLAYRFDAHWTRAMENMLDDSHLPFVHARTIGRDLRPTADSRLSYTIDEQPWGGSWTTEVDGVTQGHRAEYRWPNTMLLRIPVPNQLLGIHFTAIPEDDGHVRILQLSVRGFLRWPLLDPLFHYTNRRVLYEDRAVVESNPRPVPAPAEERSVGTDAPTLAFRRRYLQELAASAAA